MQTSVNEEEFQGRFVIGNTIETKLHKLEKQQSFEKVGVILEITFFMYFLF